VDKGLETCVAGLRSFFLIVRGDDQRTRLFDAVKSTGLVSIKTGACYNSVSIPAIALPMAVLGPLARRREKDDAPLCSLTVCKQVFLVRTSCL
jgi:hypothetical protein